MGFAVARGLRPTSLLLRKQPHSKWSEMDFLLYEAYCIYEAEHQTRTGIPFYVARSNDPDVEFRIEEQVDYAEELLDEHTRKAAEKRPKDQHDDGVKTAVMAYDRTTGEPIQVSGLGRERWYAMLEKNAAGPQEAITPSLPGSDVMIHRRRPKDGYDMKDYQA